MHARVDVADVTDYLVIIVAAAAVCACAGGQGSLCGEVELSPLQSSDHFTVTTESVQFIMLLTHILTFLSSPLSIFILLISLSFNFSGASYSFFCFRQL